MEVDFRNTAAFEPLTLSPTPQPWAVALRLAQRGRTVRRARAVHALCARCAKSWPFSTTGSSVSSEDWKDVIEWLLQWTGL